MKRQLSKKEREARFLVKCILFMIILGLCVYLSNGKDNRRVSQGIEQVQLIGNI